MTMQTGKNIRRWRRLLHRQLSDPFIRFWVGVVGAFLGGFCLSAASLAQCPQPICPAVLCAGLPGWLGGAFAVGGSLGYWLFWGQAGVQGIGWIAAALPVCVLLSSPKQKLLLPTLSALIVASGGLIFQLWQGQNTATSIYLLRIALAFGMTCIAQMLQRQDPAAQSLALAIGVLALAQIAPVGVLNLGMVAAAAIGLTGSFPTVALVGLALDISQVTPVPMTAVLCVGYLLGRIAWLPKKLRPLIPALVYVLIMGLCSQSRWQCVPALVLGGIGSVLVPDRSGEAQEHSPESYIQSRLERVSAVLAQAQQMLQGTAIYPPDEAALILRAADRACADCDCRKDCPVAERAKLMPQTILHQSSITVDSVPAGCRRKSQMLAQLQQSQDQYRLLLADRLRQQEYRSAVMQQYGFLSEYLQTLADEVPYREEKAPAFRPEVAVCSRGREVVNGDRCFWFPGTKGRYYLLLCDGMGTGVEAAYEARMAGGMLRRMLTAGYPAHGAMQSINSLCALRSSAGAVTVDLAEADLLTGRVTLYKWGAAPSWLLGQGQIEKIGRECLPPGLSLEESRESVERVTLQNEEVLVMLSDGVDGEAALAALHGQYDQPAGFLAALILEAGADPVPDDATAAVLRLHRIS